MAEAADQSEDVSKKASKLPLLLGLLLAMVAGGGAFFAVYTELVFASGAHAENHSEEGGETHEEPQAKEMPDVAFVPLAPMTVSLMEQGRDRHLRFRAQLETPGKYQGDVQKLLPRIVDVLNSYLRAVELKDLKDAAALVRLRAQMLRRIEIVVGAGKVNDVLIMEFVLN